MGLPDWARPRPAATAPTAARPSAAAQRAAQAERRGAGLPLGFWIFAFTLLPLVWFTFFDDGTAERVKHSLDSHPEVVERLEKSGKEFKSFRDALHALAAAMPDGRFEGAHLAAESWMHWLYALISMAAFLGLILLLFPQSESVRSGALLVTGAVTGTVGVLLLIVFQVMSGFATGFRIRGGGIVALIWLILVVISWGYSAADDPDNGFLLSFLAFTISVGLCEELTKLLPVYVRLRSDEPLDWNGAVLLGLASGAGFGISEGIMYSSTHYNGISGGGIYLVRFVSCVALHAIWSATCGLFAWYRQAEFDQESEWHEQAFLFLQVMAGPMILHALYDTMLKRGMGVPAMITAVLSFVLLAAVMHWTHARETERAAKSRRRRQLAAD